MKQLLRARRSGRGWMFRWSDSDLILFFVGARESIEERFLGCADRLLRRSEVEGKGRSAPLGMTVFLFSGLRAVVSYSERQILQLRIGASANQEEKATSGCRLTEGFLRIPCPYGNICTSSGYVRGWGRIGSVTMGVNGRSAGVC